MKKVIVYGAGIYGKVFFYEAEKYGVIDIEAFTADMAYIEDSKQCGLPIVPFEEIESIYPIEKYDMIVVCGYGTMRNRKVMYEKAKNKGYTLVNYISPGAILENEIKMGENNIIMSNSYIGFDGVMGNGNIIRQNVYLGHQFNICNHSIISPGCTLGGSCKIEDLVFIGMGVTVRSYVTFGTESLIGVGSNIVKNVEPYCTYYGNPAKKTECHKDTGTIIKEIGTKCDN